MKKHMSSEIKKLIQSHPQIGKILEEYGIGCTNCTVGSCKLEDVIKIHELAPQKFSQMMYLVEKVLYPDREVNLPTEFVPIESKKPPEIKYSPPIRKLVDEHIWIKRLLACIPGLISKVNRPDWADWKVILQTIDFIRGFADHFHHMKEEDILFEYTKKEAEIIQVILEDHRIGRNYVKEAAKGVQEEQKQVVCENLQKYQTLLCEHIKKEDEVLFPYIDRGLSTKQVGELFRRFNEVESALEKTIPQKYHDFVIEIEKSFEG